MRSSTHSRPSLELRSRRHWPWVSGLPAACALMLFWGSVDAVGAGPLPEDAELFRAMPKRVPEGIDELAFTAGSWAISGGRLVAESGGSSGLIELDSGGSASLTLKVSRGNKDFARRRYLFLVDASSGSNAGKAVVTLACDGEHSSTRSIEDSGWVLVDEIADTPPLYAGHTSSSLTIKLAAPNGTVRFRRPRLYHVPGYGVRLRFTVLSPGEGKYNGRLYVIRRHRDTGHADRIRHYYHSAIPDIAGANGVAAGNASSWFDLRPYLFGRSRSTVSLTVGENALPDADRVIRARLEVAFCMDDEVDQANPVSSAQGDDLTLLADDLADLDLSLDEDRDKEPEALLLWEGELHSKRGIFSFLMPESDMNPSAFLEGLLSLDGDAVDRLAQVQTELPPLVPNENRILIGANVSRLTGLIDEASIEKEMELLAALGLNAVTAEEICSRAFYDARRNRHGQTLFRNREYWARAGSAVAGYSPYDGDKLRTVLDAHYATLARQHPVFGNPTNSHNAYLFDLMDEPGNWGISDVEQDAFAAFLKSHGVTPQQVGFETWEAVRTYGYVEEKAFVPPELPAGFQDALQGADLPPLEEQVEEDHDEDPADDDAPPQNIEQKRLYYFTRRFSAQKTSDFFKTATEVIGRHFPGVLTCVNFRAGIRRVLTPETADWFLMGREKAVTMMWNEDWLNTYGWRNNGIQLVSYYVELMRTAARKHKLPVGGFLICYWGQAELKSYSALAHGSRYLNYWRYGPAYANYLPYSWSHNPDTVRQIGTVCRDIARLDATLPDAVREPAPVALLYAKTDPIWRRSQTENRLVFMALLHDQVPVDIITEAQIEEDGLLEKYRALYVTDVSVRSRTLARIAKWVRAGGNVWLSGGAGTRDEFDEPCPVLMDVLGVASTTIAKEHMAIRQPEGEPGAEVAMPYLIRGGEESTVAVYFKDGSAAQLAGKAGQGRYRICAFRPGELYEGTVRPLFNRNYGKGRIQNGWRRERREWITSFALELADVRPVTLDRPCIEAIVYRHPARDIVMLINYTGDYPDTPMQVKVTSREEVSRVESLRHGDLPFEQATGVVSFSLPIDRTDSVLLHASGDSHP